MRHVRHSLFAFMVLVLLIAGVIGFNSSENITGMDAFHATVAALTFSSDSTGYTDQGRLLNSALALASAAVIVWAFVNFHVRSADADSQASEYFKFIPKGEGLIMKEILIAKKSHMAGKKKLEVLQKTGTVVMGVKKADSFQLNVPFTQAVTANSRILAMGTASQIKELEREAKG
ncbi:hypothetical protein HYX10_00370 [Candidatus Woesearchaeota archaeon]|nr:hypothetical protein [Candidatus Woesearchaeota archaeon]